MKNWRVATVGRTEMQIHPAVLVFIVYAWLTRHLVFALVALISIILHEFAHAALAFLYGQPIRCIELTPLGATLRMDERGQLSVIRRLSILAAGPMISWFLCLLSVWLVHNSRIPFELCRLLFTSNLSILMINLIPAYPLDGGRLLALALEYFIPEHMVHRMMRIIGTMIGFALIALNLYFTWKFGGWNYSLALSGSCMIYSAHAEALTWSMTELRGFLDRKIALEKRRCMPLTCFATLSNVKIQDVIRRLPPRKMAAVICIEPGSMKCLGCLMECEIIQHYLERPTAEVIQVLKMSHNSKYPSKYDTI